MFSKAINPLPQCRHNGGVQMSLLPICPVSHLTYYTITMGCMADMYTSKFVSYFILLAQGNPTISLPIF